jgi:hypothetical protein
MSGKKELEGTATGSTDSGQGSEPLSDAFVAVAAGGRARQDSLRVVEAPKSSDRFFIRRSARVASSRSHSVQASALNPSAVEIVDALPGGKHRVGYAYEVLETVGEAPGPSIRPVGPAGNASSLRDAAIPQLGPITNRKRSATSAVSGSDRRGPISKRLASAADSIFHLVISTSLLVTLPFRHFCHPIFLSYLHLTSSPTSPFLLRRYQRHSELLRALDVSTRQFRALFPRTLYYGRDLGPPWMSSHLHPDAFLFVLRTASNTAWAAAEGLLPIREGFTAPGYVPAHVVGGITYTVRSPKTRSPQARRPSIQPVSMGRQLFAELADVGMQGNGEQHFDSRGVDLPQQDTSQPRATLHLPQQIALQGIDPPQRSTTSAAAAGNISGCSSIS